jgi:ABC-2 type transport system ATP-binding protein
MISVENLTKRFGTKLAVNDISFEVGKGEVLGFLGPNGAGKSTTMRMITGYFEPSAGSVMIDGVSMLDAPRLAKEKIGYLPENAPLYNDMTVLGFLGFSADLRGLTGTARSAAIGRALETCFLEPVRNQSIDTLSKGYRHRTCLAQSIIHDPEILILDEPTDGLDPNQKAEVRNLIKRMGETRTIVFSTHILEEVEAACTRAIIIDQGKIVADGTPDELKSRAVDAGALEVRIQGPSASAIREELGRLSCTKTVTTNSEHQPHEGEESGCFTGSVIPKGKDKTAALTVEINDLCRDRGFRIEELYCNPGRLDDVFRSITQTAE